MPPTAALAPALGDLFDLVPPGTVHLVLTTPLGTAILDPFAPPDPTTTQVLQALGIGVTVRLGPPSAEEVGQPSLGENLKVLGLLAGGALLFYMTTRRRR